METERELLIGIAEALALLLRDNEPSKIARDWQHDQTPSHRLQRLAERAKSEWGTEAPKAPAGSKIAVAEA